MQSSAKIHDDRNEQKKCNEKKKLKIKKSKVHEHPLFPF